MDHPFGLLSLLPPLVAIVLAIGTRRVVLSLFLGVLVGALILTGGNVRAAVELGAVDLLGPSLAQRDHLYVFAFTALMGAMIGVMNRTGGMHGLVERIARRANNRRRGQLITWALGLVVFFDDYANTLLLGGTMRPLADRLRISREKLAFLVDSTAAPVAGLALISTWVAAEIGYIESGFAAVGLADSIDGMSIFIATIPYRFYVLLALVFVAAIGWTGRDFGPMLVAERRAIAGTDEGAAAADSVGDLLPPDDATPRRWWNAVLPIVVTVVGILAVLAWTGAEAVGNGPANFAAWIRKGDTYLALVEGSMAGLLTAAVLAITQRILRLGDVLAAAARGGLLMVPALAILWMAWALAIATDETMLGTGGYLASLTEGILSPQWMPTVAFVLAAGLAFATGSSWAAMGILMPLVIQVTYNLLLTTQEAVPADSPILLAAIGSVLAGAIFGDHCSPVSDTTVLSSRACGCDHVAHVWTQLPYAVVVAVVSIVCGTLPVGWGISPWPLLIVAVLVLLVWLRLVGRRADAV